MPIKDRESLFPVYDDVRADGSSTTWATCVYDGNYVVLGETGDDYSTLLGQFTPDTRVYAFVRVETGDELSKRAKFALITWVGGNVGAMKKAKMSTDKADVKLIFKDYACEILADDLEEVQYDTVLEQVKKVGGANYGTGVRD